MTAQGDQPLVRTVGEPRDLRGERDGRSHAQEPRQETHAFDVQGGEARERPGEQRLEGRKDGGAERRAPRVRLERLAVLAPPGSALVDRDLAQQHREAVMDRDGQPLPAGRGADAIAVLPFVLPVLDHVEQHHPVHPVHLVEEPQPGEVLRLMRGEPHAPSLLPATGRRTIGLLISRYGYAPSTSRR